MKYIFLLFPSSSSTAYCQLNLEYWRFTLEMELHAQLCILRTWFGKTFGDKWVLCSASCVLWSWELIIWGISYDSTACIRSLFSPGNVRPFMCLSALKATTVFYYPLRTVLYWTDLMLEALQQTLLPLPAMGWTACAQHPSVPEQYRSDGCVWLCTLLLPSLTKWPAFLAWMQTFWSLHLVCSLQGYGSPRSPLPEFICTCLEAVGSCLTCPAAFPICLPSCCSLVSPPSSVISKSSHGSSTCSFISTAEFSKMSF